MPMVPAMNFWCSFLATSYLVLSVHSIPATPTTVTLYEVIPSQRLPSDTSQLSPTPIATYELGTNELDISVVGVSTDSAGSQTTYSIGRYYSLNDIITNTITASQGEVTTETSTIGTIVQTSNETIVQSAGGFWETIGPANGDARGEYISCTWNPTGTEGVCTEVDLIPTVATESGTATITATATVVYTGVRGTLAVWPSATASTSAARSAFSYSGKGVCVALLTLIWLLV